MSAEWKHQPHPEAEAEARADLEAKVRELFDPLMQACMNILASLRLSGSGVVEEHMRHECNYMVPKALMAAVLREMSDRFYGFTDQNKVLTKKYF